MSFDFPWMLEEPSSRTVPPVTAERLLAGIALAVPVVALLWVSSYSKPDPVLGGMPLFYWYQLMWIPLTALFTGAAHLLLTWDEKNRAAARGGDAS
ncbi:DUF3311 domain-containing protein [Kitasatospora sp. NPDC056531]|uniref:DUF3311 domain-containing protein n=1 Tax=Kitasatospora sp. NPDC056531 TaxID=3345856 RepID=UPI003675AAD4